MQAFREFINQNKSRNVRFVKVKSDRKCFDCGKVIPRGIKCLTVNKKYKGRVWHCMSCVERNVSGVSIQEQLNQVRAEKNSINFGDEGGWLALDYIESKLLEELG